MKLFETLNASGARYVVIGGLASLLHGVGRTTTDVDICLDFATDSVLPAIDGLSASGYRPTAPVNVHDLANVQARARWQHDNSMVVFSLWDANNRQPTLDIMLDPVVPFPELWRDALTVPMSGTAIRIASIAHLMQLKQHAGRPQDLADIDALRRIEALKSRK
jgi:predicted nucleotidyltransferase